MGYCLIKLIEKIYNLYQDQWEKKENIYTFLYLSENN